MKFFSKLLMILLLFALIFIAFYKPVYASDDKKDLPSADEFVPLEVLPEMTYTEKPVYPEKAEEAGIEGMVWVRSLIDKDGSVVKSEISKSSGSEELDKSALAAAPKCLFKPGKNDKQPVASWVTYKVVFTLDKHQVDKKIKKE
ncbi:MAG: energy transducer TonB [Candidatus Zixiibacteriota bacterium]